MTGILASIGFKQELGGIMHVFLHNADAHKLTAFILKKYNSADDVRRLVNNGDLSFLADTIDDCEFHRTNSRFSKDEVEWTNTLRLLNCDFYYLFVPDEGEFWNASQWFFKEANTDDEWKVM